MNHHPAPNGTKKVRVILRVLFVVFTFCYLYYLQGDLLALTQKRLSHGPATYHPLAGALVLTALLTLLQYFVARHIRMAHALHAVTYAPSVILIGLITSATDSLSVTWMVSSIILLCLCGGACWISRQIDESDMPASARLIRIWMPNLWIFILLFTFVGITGNTDECLHYELKVGRLLNEKRHQQALEIGKKSLTTSRRLEALRAIAMNREIGNKLFEYPVLHGSYSLMLYPADSARTLYTPDSLYRYFRCYPRNATPTRYYHYIATHPHTTAHSDIAREFYLCALLLDKQIDRFALEISDFYNLSDSTLQLPKYYAQALTLYRHIRTHPVITYNDAAMTENLNDFLRTARSTTIPNTRKSVTRLEYGNTYWWYYFFQPVCQP